MNRLQLESMPIQRFSCVLSPKETTTLPPFLGSTLRGAFGMALRSIGCTKQCNETKHHPDCVYAYCFETPIPPGSTKKRGISHAPHPFVFQTPLTSHTLWKPYERLSFSVVLFGKGVDYSLYFIAAIAEMVQTGLGIKQAPFQLEEIWDTLHPKQDRCIWAREHGMLAPLSERNAATLFDDIKTKKRVKVLFQTPLRIFEKKRLVSPLSFRSFARSLLARYSSLLFFHCGIEFDVPYKEILAEAEQTQTIKDNLALHQLYRWSNRQKRKLSTDGLIGDITWEGKAIETLWPLLQLGQLFHTGKGTVMSHGQYKLS